jgi:membrane-bound serine protease (ClpP class)
MFVDPNIAYILLVFGTLALMMALVTPGTYLLEGSALLLLALAGYEIYNLGFNLWALIVLVIALVPFIYAIRKPRREWALALAILCLLIGSLYLFPGQGILPAVNPLLAVVLSILSAGFLWFVVRQALLAHLIRPLQNLDSLTGKIGQAKTRILQNGVVQVAGELWSARSEQDVTAGAAVRVLGRDGFVLLVEKAEQK